MSISYPGESAQYRQARHALLKEELALRSLTERVAALRRTLPEGGAVSTDYAFTTLTEQKINLASLFTTKRNTLAIYSLMYGPQDSAPCPMCVSLLDGLEGQARSIGQSIDLVVVSAATPEHLTELAKTRHWSNLRLPSAQDTNYQADYHGQMPNGAQLPMMNVFRKNGSEVTHFWGSEGFFADVEGQARHVDTIWPLWNMLDMTPDGRADDWYPKL